MKYRTEEELCDAFADHARAAGWTVYPECSGWDLLLERDGIQIGVEAKLRPCFEVLLQALRPAEAAHCGGPMFHAVLVPEMRRAFRSVAFELGIGVYHGDFRSGFGSYWKLDPSRTRDQAEPRFLPALEPPRTKEWRHRKPAWTPPVEVTGNGAGRAAPRQLTPWKIKAVLLCAVLRDRGWVTSADFKAIGIDPNRWRQLWLDEDGKDGRLKRYVARPGVDLPDAHIPPEDRQRIVDAAPGAGYGTAEPSGTDRP